VRGVGWIHLAEDKDQWRIVASTERGGEILTSLMTIFLSGRTLWN